MRELERETYLRVINPRMISGHLQGKLLEMLVRMMRPQRVLEIGTFTGYSAICLGAALPADGHLDTLELNDELEDLILEVLVPTEDVVEERNGKEKVVTRKIFPGYVLIKMVMTDDTWYVVRNTRGVTGFVGPGSKPVPLTEEELKALDFGNEIDVEFAEGDVISVTAGVWKDTVGSVQKIDATRQTVTINVEMFGRETPVEIHFSDVKKL